MIHAFGTPEPQYNSVESYLLDLAKGVATLVDGKPGVVERFREQIEVYARTWERWTEAQKAEQENRWTPAIGRPEDPLAVFSPMYNNAYRPEIEAKQLPGFYSLLAFLHDRELPHLEKINNGIMTSAEIIRETLLAPGNEREGVNALRSDISCMVEVDAIEECFNWVSIDLRDHFGENNAGDGQTAAGIELRIKAMSDTDLFQHLAQVLELRPLLELLKDKTWRAADRALAPWFVEAIRRLEGTRADRVGLLKYKYQCFIGSVRNTQTRNVRGRAAHASPNSPFEHAGELADSFARLALEAERESELEREPRPTCDERLARLIPKLEELERRKKSYQDQCSHLSHIGTPDSHGDRYWKERVQPWIDDIELDLVEVNAAVRGHWPYASPNWEQALAIVRQGREPDSMHSVVQGFRILARRAPEQGKERHGSQASKSSCDEEATVDIPTIEEISEVIQRYEGLEREIARLKNVAENGEEPEKARAEAQKAEKFFKELCDTLAKRPFGPVRVPRSVQDRIDAMRDGGEFSGWAEAHLTVIRAIAEAYKNLPISFLRRLRTEVIPGIWKRDSQEVAAGMTAGDLKNAVALVEKTKECELSKQIYLETVRIITAVDLILCPYREFLQREFGDGPALGTDTCSFGGTIHWYRRIKRQLEVRAQHPAAEQPPTRQEQTKKETKKRTVKTAGTDAPRKFQPWPNPGDACFIIEGGRVFFHHDGEMKDLHLKSLSSTQDLLIALHDGTLQSQDIKTRFCKGTTKPIQVVSRANERLNASIRKAGFTCLPEHDVEFVRYVRAFDHYENTLPVHPSMNHYKRAQDDDMEA